MTTFHLRILRLTALAFATVHAPSGHSADPQTHADTILVNGGIYTVDPERSWAQAMAIRDGRIVALGVNEKILALKGPSTRVIDLTGRMALPGFHDSHVHVASAGLAGLQCPLAGLQSVEAILEAVASCAAASKEEWIVGRGWDLGLFVSSGPRKELLDDAVPGRAVILEDGDGHTGWASSRALELAGITAETPDPENGRIERDPVTGEPSGTLREAALDQVMKAAPQPSPEMRQEGVRMGVQRVNEVGITSFIEAEARDADFDAFRSVQTSGKLTAKVRLSITYGVFGSDDFETLFARRKQLTGPRLNADSVKIFLDGVIEGETAALLTPYLDRPDHFGDLTMSVAALNAAVTRFDALGVQMHLHAIGDATTRAALDAVSAARANNGVRDNRHHIVHLQLIHPDDIPRFAELEVAANFQALWSFPYEEILDLNMAQVGAERVNRMFPAGSVRRSGGRLVAGSDWPVSTVNPWPAIEVALTRQDPDSNGGDTLNVHERIDLASMIAAYTINGAWLMHQEKDTGSIEVGKSADIVVIDREVFSLPATQLSDVRVDLTMLDGEVIYRREP